MTRLVSLLLASILLVACDDDDPVVIDAGTDATPFDAAIDPDAGDPDAGDPDAGALDAGSDSGPPDAGPTLEYGASCTSDAQCISNLCLMVTGAEPTCSRECNLDVPHACRAEGTLCVPAGSWAVCFGPDIDTGSDTDDANLTLGDCVTRTLRPLGADADLFQVRAATDDPIVVSVQPEDGVDVELDFYDGAGELVARQNMNAAGGIEGLRFTEWTSDGIVFVLVKDAGSSIANPYRVCVETAE